MKSIILINVFMGDFPWYFDYFVKSCSHNPTVNFYIFCDKSYSKTIPENLKLLNLTLDQFNDLATSKLDLEISIKKAYKLCDLKPAYGVIFSDYLKGYDFWGFCDIDVIFGQIRTFMTDTVLSDYEVISVRPDFPTGYFMLFKNEKKINTLFTLSKDYELVFQSKKHFCFDECNFKHKYVSAGYNILEIPCEIESMHHVLVREREQIKVFWDFLIIEGRPGNLKWDTGQLIFQRKYEALLYHLGSFKSNKYIRKQRPKKIAEKFNIHKYHIQNRSYHVFKTTWDYFRLEKISPLFRRLFWQAEYLISFLLYNPPKSDDSTESVFSNNKMFIKKRGGKYLMLSYDEDFKSHKRIVPSCFNSQVFYIKGRPFNKHFITDSSESTTNLEIVSIDGNIFKHKLKAIKY